MTLFCLVLLYFYQIFIILRLLILTKISTVFYFLPNFWLCFAFFTKTSSLFLPQHCWLCSFNQNVNFEFLTKFSTVFVSFNQSKYRLCFYFYQIIDCVLFFFVPKYGTNVYSYRNVDLVLLEPDCAIIWLLLIIEMPHRVVALCRKVT